MCDRCGEPGLGAHGVSIMERPAQRLVGLMWEGTFDEARSGALHRLMERIKQFSDAQAGLWKSPIVGISWNDRPDGFRHFVGISSEDPVPDGMAALDLPDMRLAGSWHGEGDGEVVDHLVGMVAWLRESGLPHDRSVFDQREEYPPDVDLSRPPALRLMLPVG